MTAKVPGRLGNSPVIGAGIWADDATAAISATGHGEHFSRHAIGHEIDARMGWVGQNLAQALADVVAEPDQIGGSGGLIAVNTNANIHLAFNNLLTVCRVSVN